MRVGDPLEASYELAGPIAAGNWRLIGDSIVIRDIDARFEVVLRKPDSDTLIVAFDHRFVKPEGNAAFSAVPHEADQTGAAADAEAGDLLVLRFIATSTRTGPAYVPNGDGEITGGRIPSITLP